MADQDNLVPPTRARSRNQRENGYEKVLGWPPPGVAMLSPTAAGSPTGRHSALPLVNFHHSGLRILANLSQNRYLASRYV